MRIKLSKSQWEEAGRKAGWITSSINSLDPKIIEESVKKYVDRILKGESFEKVLKNEEYSIKRLVERRILQQLTKDPNEPQFYINPKDHSQRTVKDDKPRFFVPPSKKPKKSLLNNTGFSIELPKGSISDHKQEKQEEQDKPRFFAEPPKDPMPTKIKKQEKPRFFISK